MPHLPDDIVELIVRHAAALTIQRRARRRAYRHTRQREWRALRRLLCECLTPSSLDGLSRCALVRREWRTEPASWITEVTSDPSIPAQILDETARDLWRAPSPARVRTSCHATGRGGERRSPAAGSPQRQDGDAREHYGAGHTDLRDAVHESSRCPSSGAQASRG